MHRFERRSEEPNLLDAEGAPVQRRAAVVPHGESGAPKLAEGLPAAALVVPPEVRLALERVVEQLDVALPDANSRVLLVTGAQRGDGASTIACWLLSLLAASNREGDLVYVDAASHTGAIAAPVAVPDSNAGGTGRAVLQARPTAVPRLFALKAREGSASRHVSPHVLVELLAKLRKRFAWVVIDAAPPAVSPLSVFLSQHVDGVLVVLRMDRTDRLYAQSTIDLIRHNGGKMIGAVLNNCRS